MSINLLLLLLRRWNSHFNPLFVCELSLMAQNVNYNVIEARWGPLMARAVCLAVAAALRGPGCGLMRLWRADCSSGCASSASDGGGVRRENCFLKFNDSLSLSLSLDASTGEGERNVIIYCAARGSLYARWPPPPPPCVPQKKKKKRVSTLLPLSF